MLRDIKMAAREGALTYVKRGVIAQVLANRTVLALEELLLSICGNSRVIVFRFNSKTHFTGAMLVALGRAPTWRLHAKLFRITREWKTA